MLNIQDIKDIPAIAKMIAAGFDVTGVYQYNDTQGDAIYWRVRLDDKNGKKQYRPIRIAAGDVYEIGEPEHIKQGLKPLYQLQLLVENPQAHVWLVEGEKCADKLNDFFATFATFGIFGQHVATTSGSATSADKADWNILTGRDVTIWPDCDETGLPYAMAVAERLDGIANSVSCIDAEIIDLSDGEDCFEWLQYNPDATIDDLMALPKKLPNQLNNSDVEIICMSDIEMKPIEWLWPKRIACGKITVVAGNPGLGKSQLTAWLASIVTQGERWLDSDTKTIKGEVIFLSAEDDAADTIKPRLIAAGADVSHCHVLEAVNVQSPDGKVSKRGFDLSQDIERMSYAIESRNGNVKLLIIDPISAYLGKVDSNKNAEIRGLMMQLKAVAEKNSIAIVLITHNSKDDKKSAIDRVIGSIGMVAAARAAYTVLQDNKSPETRYFIPIKNNIGNDKDGFSFRIEGVELANDIPTSKIVWGESVNAHEILHPEREKKDTAPNDAQAFLQELLADKPMLAKDIFDQAEGAGYSKATMQRAKKRLGIKHKKLGMEEGWEWSLPDLDDGYNPNYEGNEGIEDYEDNNDICEGLSATFAEECAPPPEDATHNNMQSSIPSQPSGLQLVIQN